MAKEINDNRKLRREVEALKAQLKSGGSLKSKKHASAKIPESGASLKSSKNVDVSLIKKDFLKTIILSAFAFGIIIALWAFKINLSIL